MDLQKCPACGASTFDLHLTIRGYCLDCDRSGQAAYDRADRAGNVVASRSMEPWERELYWRVRR